MDTREECKRIRMEHDGMELFCAKGSRPWFARMNRLTIVEGLFDIPQGWCNEIISQWELCSSVPKKY